MRFCVFSARMRRALLHSAVSALAFVAAGFITSCTERPADGVSIGGRATYLRYCASCHGDDGHGDGPVAPDLVTRPPDLTKLASRAGGRFDVIAVTRSVDGRRALKGHGSQEMPVWGVVFVEDLRDAERRYPRYTALLSTRELVEYLRGIQRQD